MTQAKKTTSTVDLSKVKFTLVDAALARHGLPVGGTDQQKVQRLTAWYANPENVPKEDVADCSTCGGDSDVKEPACPYCGDGDTITSQPAPRPPLRAVAPAAARPTPPGPSSIAVAGARLESRTFGGTVSAPSSVPLQPAAELDKAVARIHRQMRGAADSLWEVGSELQALHQRNLWKARKDEKGEEKYKSWGQFCETELGFSHGYSLKLIDVAEVYTREQVAALGVSKLYITLQVPKEDREKLLATAQQGASREELKEAAREVGKTPRPELAGADGKGRSGKGGAGTHKPGSGGKRGRKPEKITVAALTTRVELPLLTQKGTKLKLKLPGPVAVEERMTNGVKQRFVVTNDDDGFLLLIVERVRE